MLDKRVWWKESVGYEIYIRSFFDSNNDGVGDLNGITSKLNYIKSIGVDFIWICPFYDSPMDDNGYDIRDYKKVLAEYGTIADFKNLIEKAHELGLKVLIDLVLNHTSDENEWFIKSKNREDGYDDFYYWKDGYTDKDGILHEPNNWESFFGGSAWKFDMERGQYYLKLFSNKMPDVNYESKLALEKMGEVITWWCSLGVDGFRVDAISHIGKDLSFKNGKKHKTYKKFSNQPNAHRYLRELAHNWRRFDAVSVGELGGAPTQKDNINFTKSENSELDIVFDFDHLKQLKTDKNGVEYINGKGLQKALIKKQEIIREGGWSALFWTNHDYQRVASLYGDEKNLSKSCSALAVLMYLLKGTPIIYNGEEIGMTNYPFKTENDFEDVNAKTLLMLAGTEEEKASTLKKLKRESRDNARTIMQWSGAINAGFSEEKPWFVVNPNYHNINVERELLESCSVLNEYIKILKLRASDKEIFCYGDSKFLKSKKGIIQYKRFMDGSDTEYLVIVNTSNCVQKFLYPDGDVVYSNYGEIVRGEISPYEAVVIKKGD